MKHLLWFAFLLLFWPSNSHAQILAKSHTLCAGTFTSGQSCVTPSVAVAQNDVLVAVHGSGSVNPTDNCALTWHDGPISQASGGRTIKLRYTDPAPAAGNCVFTYTTTASFTALEGIQVYSGVSGIGQSSNAQAAMSGVNCSASLGGPVGASGNFVVGGFGWGGVTQGIVTAGSRVDVWIASQQVSLGDNEPSASTNPAVVNLTSASGTCARVAMELVAGTIISPKIASTADQMQSIILLTAGGKDYSLPATALSPNNQWCTWVMPGGAVTDTFRVTVDPTKVLNNQSSPITIPSWQMTRICQTNSGNFWINPPFVAGSGITFTATPTGTTISTGVGATISKINGGDISVGDGTIAIVANSCANLPSTPSTASVTGVVQTDVVNFTAELLTTGWGNGSVILRPLATAGAITWRACNVGTTSQSPTALPVHWLVIR